MNTITNEMIILAVLCLASIASALATVIATFVNCIIARTFIEPSKKNAQSVPALKKPAQVQTNSLLDDFKHVQQSQFNCLPQFSAVKRFAANEAIVENVTNVKMTLR